MHAKLFTVPTANNPNNWSCTPSSPAPSLRKLAAKHFKGEMVNNRRWNKQRWSLDLYEYHVHRSLLYSYTRSEIPQSRLWQNHSKGYRWYRANPSLFVAKLIDTRQKSMNDKQYTKETLDFHIQPAKAAFYWLAFFQSYSGISLFVFPRIETKNANQSNKLVCD